MPQYQYITASRYQIGIRIPKRTKRRLAKMKKRFIRRAKLLAVAFVKMICIYACCLGVISILMAMLLCLN